MIRKLLCLVMVVFLASCSREESGWIQIFDGENVAGLRQFNGVGFPKNWEVSEGELRAGLSNNSLMAPELIYDKTFKYFELEFDWKLLAQGANSGVLYHVREGDNYKYSFETGPEYQLYDDSSFPEIDNSVKTASNFAMNPANTEGLVKPVGEWNTSKIVVTSNKVTHWLNGKEVLSFVPWSKEWLMRKSQSKWENYPDYAKSNEGFIAFQDHGGAVAFRNIRVKELAVE